MQEKCLHVFFCRKVRKTGLERKIGEDHFLIFITKYLIIINIGIVLY